jgi:hypothetical protein
MEASLETVLLLYCVGRSAHKLANFVWSWGKNVDISGDFRAPGVVGRY